MKRKRGKKAKEDVSSSLVVMLMLVALVVSVAGTWLVNVQLDVDNLPTRALNLGSPAGDVSLVLTESPDFDSNMEGNVALSIISGEGK